MYMEQLSQMASMNIRLEETAASQDFCAQYKTKLDIVGLGAVGSHHDIWLNLQGRSAV